MIYWATSKLAVSTLPLLDELYLCAAQVGAS